MDLKEQLIRIWQMKTACIIPLLPSTMGISQTIYVKTAYSSSCSKYSNAESNNNICCLLRKYLAG
jgi:hypothetical protein